MKRKYEIYNKKIVNFFYWNKINKDIKNKIIENEFKK